MPAFGRYIGVDHSGAETSTASEESSRFMAEGGAPLVETRLLSVRASLAFVPDR
jgi:hypothetical protein